jgi:cell division control protein 6
MQAVKEALHVATVPSCGLVCRDDEQRRVFEFCKGCVEQERAGSLYVCGCPGTGKTLSINKVKERVSRWADEVYHDFLDQISRFRDEALSKIVTLMLCVDGNGDT